MNTLPVYQVDAFTSKLFGGNPAGVVPLEAWLPDEMMQQIAMENNLAETAFIVKESEGYRIRWFTPAVEVDLCGHATLAAAFVFFNERNHSGNSISFDSRSGVLTVTKNGDELVLDFPKDDVTEIPLSEELLSAFAAKPVAAFKGKTDYMLVFRSEGEIATMVPDLPKINPLPVRGVIVTAPGNEVDFVSRFFAPQSGIDEDPVTGSAHTTLTPYWSEKLGKTTLTAAQISPRRGELTCTLQEHRVLIAGQARLYLKGEIFVP
jgi:PhzF family phenazine biosynthesis protein